MSEDRAAAGPHYVISFPTLGRGIAVVGLIAVVGWIRFCLEKILVFAYPTDVCAAVYQQA
ncbi:MAG TPA: hypothetical protein EYM69_01390 [Dehalococcoidia bacterium]|nr:hypothetical protein [Dehalococcoidia bacterium]